MIAFCPVNDSQHKSRSSSALPAGRAGVLRRRARGALHRVLHAWESRPLRAAREQRILRDHPPIFIIGAPRSGSTLLMQVCATALDVAAFTNGDQKFLGAPSLRWRRTKGITHKLGPPGFSSDYGRTDGVNGLCEFGEYWYRFFPRRPHHVTASEVNPATLRAIRRSVARLTLASNRSVLFKNLYCSLRVDALKAALPEAKWIHVQRDLSSNARSLLVGRLKNNGTIESWWSAEPPDIDRLRLLDPTDQVVRQVLSIDRYVDATCSNHIDIDYERLLESPHEVIKEVCSYVGLDNGHGAMDLKLIPTKFDRQPSKLLSEDVERALLRSVESIELAEPAK